MDDKRADSSGRYEELSGADTWLDSVLYQDFECEDASTREKNEERCPEETGKKQ